MSPNIGAYLDFFSHCRYNAKLSPTKQSYAQPSEGVKKTTPNRDRRNAEKERLKTRTQTKGDYEELSKNQENASPKLSHRNSAIDESGVQSDGEKSSKHTARSKTAFPTIKSKLPSTKSKSFVDPRLKHKS